MVRASARFVEAARLAQLRDGTGFERMMLTDYAPRPCCRNPVPNRLRCWSDGRGLAVPGRRGRRRLAQSLGTQRWVPAGRGSLMDRQLRPFWLLAS